MEWSLTQDLMQQQSKGLSDYYQCYIYGTDAYFKNA